MSWMRFRRLGSWEMVTIKHFIGATREGRDKTWSTCQLSGFREGNAANASSFVLFSSPVVMFEQGVQYPSDAE